MKFFHEFLRGTKVTFVSRFLAKSFFFQCLCFSRFSNIAFSIIKDRNKKKRICLDFFSLTHPFPCTFVSFHAPAFSKELRDYITDDREQPRHSIRSSETGKTGNRMKDQKRGGEADRERESTEVASISCYSRDFLAPGHRKGLSHYHR